MLINSSAIHSRTENIQLLAGYGGLRISMDNWMRQLSDKCIMLEHAHNIKLKDINTDARV